MIGPNIKTSKVKSLFEIFTGDGIINGVFFKKDRTITYVQHLIQTEKMQHESRFGKLMIHPIFMPILMFLHNCGLTPNPIGVANTAFMKTSTRLFTLFERDLPYEIYLDYDKNRVKTLGKVNCPSIQHFSGHSRFENDRIKTIGYKMWEKRVEYREFDDDFILKRSMNFPTNYLPIIHDFITTESNTILFADAPFKFSRSLINPVIFDKNQTTIFHIEKRNMRYKIDTNESFYIFHYGPVKENTTSIEFYAATYENIDFSKIDIRGKYRRFHICLKTEKVTIEQNEDLEEYNLDFPVKYGKYTILRSLDMKNRRINGFVLCDGLEIYDRFFFEDRNFCGEPAITKTPRGQPFLTIFAYSKNGKSFLIMIRILDTGTFDKDIIEIPVPEKIGIGFHSSFFS
jgi:carotenoid cleavage dioxygenase-like enzyme